MAIPLGSLAILVFRAFKNFCSSSILKGEVFLDKVGELVSGGSIINGAFPVYFIVMCFFNSETELIFPYKCGRYALMIFL